MLNYVTTIRQKMTVTVVKSDGGDKTSVLTQYLVNKRSNLTEIQT